MACPDDTPADDGRPIEQLEITTPKVTAASSDSSRRAARRRGPVQGANRVATAGRMVMTG